MVLPALIGGGFVLGLIVGRWWSLAAAAAVGVWLGLWSEVDEVPSWYYGIASAVVASASISAGILVRRVVHRLGHTS